jgi:flagellar hook-basal body complex protein FliE
MNIAPIRIPAPIAIAPEIPKPGSASDVFGQVFSQAVAKVEGFQQNAQATVDKFLSGEGEELHKIALDSQQAQLSFDLFLQVRNKVVAAYQEVMRMQV